MDGQVFGMEICQTSSKGVWYSNHIIEMKSQMMGHMDKAKP
jgi:hypothetical protein